MMNWGVILKISKYFLKWAPPPLPPPPPVSQVTNDQPLKKTNRILHNIAAFYQKSIFGGINSKTKQIKLVTTTAQRI